MNFFKKKGSPLEIQCVTQNLHRAKKRSYTFSFGSCTFSLKCTGSTAEGKLNMLVFPCVLYYQDPVA